MPFAKRRIYVSSTFDDLKDHRTAVKVELERAGFDVESMERYAAFPEPPLDRCLEDVRRCDAHVLVVAHRYGYCPTDARGESGKSITHLEYEQAQRAGKPVFAFCVDDDADWKPRFIDRGVAAERLADFRRHVEAAHGRRLFTSPDNLAKQVLSALSSHDWSVGAADAPRADLPPASRAPALEQQITNYLRWLRERTQSIELRGIDRAGGSPIVVLPLETAYVPLSAMSLRPGREDEIRAMVLRKIRQRASLQGDRMPDDEDIERETRAAIEAEAKLTRVPLNGVLGLGRRLAVIGRPGSGKTTVLVHMAWTLAASLLDGSMEPARTRLGLADPALPLPIFVPLASYARHRRDLPAAAPARDRTLAYFIAHHLVSKQAEFSVPPDFFVQLLELGRDVVLLLDGLDEVANEDERAQVREAVEDLVRGRSELRALVTCRTAAYRSGRTALGADFKEVLVQALDHDAQIVPMVEQAYACIYPEDTHRRERRSRDLLDGILRLETDRRVRYGASAGPLVDSPLMVRLLLIVHVSNRTLPEERAALFEKAVDALMQVDYGLEEGVNRELAEDWKLYRDMAQHLAFHMHRQGRQQGREIDEPAMRHALASDESFGPRIDDFVGHARHRGSVVEERDGVYRFIHLAFQEFLVARYLREVVGAASRADILSFLEERVEDPWWREPILLLAGYWGEHAAGPAREFIRALAHGNGPAAQQCAAADLACMAAREWRKAGAPLLAQLGRRLVQMLADDTLASADPSSRMQLGRHLGAVGDIRFDAERPHLPLDDLHGFVRVAADPSFRIGVRSTAAGGAEDETNDALTPTAAFYIGRYPVTVAQYDAYLDAKVPPRQRASRPREELNHPATGVSWHDALAYCEWLQQVLSSPRFSGDPVGRLLASGRWIVTLPSELEWEKAALGGETGSLHLSGDAGDRHKAKSGRADQGTSPRAVGCFAANGYGLFDMLGNVWEWTSTHNCESYARTLAANPYALEYARPAIQPGTRIIRGGAARCAARSRLSSEETDTSVGFRVALLDTAARHGSHPPGAV
jgi:formylglycine-generating enzyme required for sulfatase activity